MTELHADDDVYADDLAEVRESGLSGYRIASCSVEVHGISYVHGFCTFHPDAGNDGSFTIVSLDHGPGVTADVSVVGTSGKQADISWSGPGGGSDRVSLGLASQDGPCWTISSGKDGTRLCAQSTPDVSEPTPDDPPEDSKDYIAYGMREGMYSAIRSRSGLDTANAEIITKADRGAAINLCRSNHDFSAECITYWMQDESSDTVTANCLTGAFSYALGCDHCELQQPFVFLGKNPDRGKDQQGPEFLIENREIMDGPLDGSWASTYDFALQAYGLLCPATLERARTSKH